MIGGRPAPAWLVAAPIAHRGLHDRAAGRIENSLAAASAAIERGYAIECDLQRTADGESFVFHDFELRRLTGRDGTIDEVTAADMSSLRLSGSHEQVPTFATLLDVVAGRVPIVCEIKSRFQGDMRLTDRAEEIASGYGGPLAFKSFDPAVIAHLRRRGLHWPLGIVAEATFEAEEWRFLDEPTRAGLAALSHYGDTRPDFLSFAVDDLPHAAPALFRAALGLPVMTWTVRGEAQRQKAAVFADQMVFEGFLP